MRKTPLPKTHFASSQSYRNLDSPVKYAICGKTVKKEKSTTDKRKVTCRICQKLLAKEKVK